MNSSAQGGFGPPDSLIQPTFDLMLEMNLLVLEYADNPYQVVGPYRPTQYAVTTPYGNAIHRLSWTANDPADPNPIVGFEVEECESPSTVADDGTMTSLWDFTGFTVAPGFAGDGYYSGSGDNLNQVLAMKRPYLVSAGDTLSMHITWDIETDWDYGYVDVSSDGGGSWASIAGNITTNTNPNGTNLGNGITGNSGGWVVGEFPLDSFAGQDILIRIRYVTDGAVVEPGLTVDNLYPVAACAGVQTIAAAYPDTTLDVTPDLPTTYRYRVRGIDAEGHASRWSNVRDYEVLTLTDAGDRVRYRTQLGANYPNPFNPTTRIPYVVGGGTAAPATPVRLTIYDVSGARVATLVDARLAPGTYEAVWNGINDAGQSMASGIYFAKLTAGAGAPLTRKLVLLK